ncbi:metacaspase-2-like [Daktulosphaira vitifoliae]|uniref:metacaspase-2-like n=1 Tax=Daktulosphaira vitifoliae TaxID=58002 RepID=UPI0021AAFEA1|nr:metacaspase-2-like [Daktulosphaira vitifoliae]
MWTNLLTISIENEKDINDYLLKYHTSHIKNAYEIKLKNIKKKIELNSTNRKDVVMLDTTVTKLVIQKSLNSCLRKQIKNFIVCLINVKSEKNELLSKVLSNSNDNDVMIVLNGVTSNLLDPIRTEYFNTTRCLRIEAEIESFVFLFKYNLLCTQYCNENPILIDLESNCDVQESNVIDNKLPNIDKPGKTLPIINDSKILSQEKLKKSIGATDYQKELLSKSVSITSDLSEDDFVNCSPIKNFSVRNEATYVVYSEDEGQLNSKNVSIDDINTQLPVIILSLSDNSSMIEALSQNSIHSNKNNNSNQSINNTCLDDMNCDNNLDSSVEVYNQNEKNIPSDNFQSSQNLNDIKTISSCRLVYSEPCIFDDNSEVVLGYCLKCSAFISKSSLEVSEFSENEIEYICPICKNKIVLTFFFKMIFLHGNLENKAIEVFCYSFNAENILKKLLSKCISIDDYLSNPCNKKEILECIRSLIRSKRKINIKVQESEINKIVILLDLEIE